MRVQFSLWVLKRQLLYNRFWPSGLKNKEQRRGTERAICCALEFRAEILSCISSVGKLSHFHDNYLNREDKCVITKYYISLVTAKQHKLLSGTSRCLWESHGILLCRVCRSRGEMLICSWDLPNLPSWMECLSRFCLVFGMGTWIPTPVETIIKMRIWFFYMYLRKQNPETDQVLNSQPKSASSRGRRLGKTTGSLISVCTSSWESRSHVTHQWPGEEDWFSQLLTASVTG